MDAEFHQRRLNNLANVNKVVRSCSREFAVGNYLAGQVIYNIGEYPARFSIAPTAYDEELLRKFAENGVSLIQIHEEWNDPLRRLGADKFSCHDPVGLRKFIDLAHKLGIKVILFISTGYFQATDPDFREEWTHTDSHLVELYFDYALCSPASPGWRAYILPRLERIMDEYGIDGLFDDVGCYGRFSCKSPLPLSHVSPSPEHDSALVDLMGIVMDLVHKRGGVFKIFSQPASRQHIRPKLYDYLWVGEGVQNLDTLRLSAKGFEPYVVPCPDMSRAVIQKEDDHYLHSVPYCQFPLRVDGRPCTGERAVVEGINYPRGEECFWTRHMRNVWRSYQQNPRLPPMYNVWDSCPGRAEGRERWLYHFNLYRPMVKDSSQAWIEVHENSLFTTSIPDQLTASLYVNDRIYLVLANYGEKQVELNSIWSWEDRETKQVKSVLKVEPRSLRYFQAAPQQ